MTMCEQRVEDRMRALFRRCPALCGFTVAHMGELSLTTHPLDVSQHGLHGMIAAELAALVMEFPEARELLRDRTFARVFH